MPSTVEQPTQVPVGGGKAVAVQLSQPVGANGVHDLGVTVVVVAVSLISQPVTVEVDVTQVYVAVVLPSTIGLQDPWYSSATEVPDEQVDVDEEI
jgi:threonine/homoserine efflux transporter RhtA